MPYDPQGSWVDPATIDRTSTCNCPGCAHFMRLHGQMPNERWLSLLTEPEFNEQGFDQFGYNSDGLSEDGYNRDGRDTRGYDRRGFNEAGFDRDGYDNAGFDRNGRDREGYDRAGYNRFEVDREGYNYDGFDNEGYNRDGYSYDGYDREGFNTRGRDREGFNRLGFDRQGYNREGFDRRGNERPCDCYDCQVERDEMPELSSVTEYDVEETEQDIFHFTENWLNNYSYTPNPLIFRRSHGEDKRAVPYYGMEIEMTSRLTEQERDLGNKIGLDNRLIYFKSDGSVAGFEAVTHPMTAKWARENFPWDFVEIMAACGASVQPECNGLHIHVSREGFDNEAHMYRWIKFWYKNQDPIINIAGRTSERWGSFDEDQRVLHLNHAKARARLRHNPGRMYSLRSAETGQRYCALNLQNEKTIEVRLFAATTSAFTLRTRFDLVAASVEYTRDLPVAKIHKGGWKWDSFLLYLDDHLGEYAALGSFENSRILAAIERRNQAHEPALTLA